MGVGVGRATWKCENESGQMILIVVPNQLKNICNMLIHKSKTSCRNTHINASGTRKKERKKDSSIEWYIYIFFWEHHGMQALIMRWPSVGVGHPTTELAASAQTITRKTHAFVSNASQRANKIGDICCFLFFVWINDEIVTYFFLSVRVTRDLSTPGVILSASAPLSDIKRDLSFT